MDDELEPRPESPTASASETASISISDPEVILLLTSHAHSPPLQPPPHLKYDLRSIENPPKALRDSHDGLSKRLREHLLSHQDFTVLLDRAETDIRTAVTELDGQVVTSGEATTLSVAAFCARGRHRSVAFVEELATRAWPSGWEVRVVHRDLQNGRSRQGKQRRGKMNGREAGGFHLVLGDE
jgi:RNase adaptor protein for sRNA GlmZ degradation